MVTERRSTSSKLGKAKGGGKLLQGPHQTRRQSVTAAGISWLSFDRQACKRCNSASVSSTNRVRRWRCSAARSWAWRSRLQCSITRRWLSTKKDWTPGDRSDTGFSGENRTLVSTFDMIEYRGGRQGCDLRPIAQIASQW